MYKASSKPEVRYIAPQFLEFCSEDFRSQKQVLSTLWWNTQNQPNPRGAIPYNLCVISRKRILIHISWGLNSIFFFVKHFLSVLKISKTFVVFLTTSSEFLTRYGQGYVFKDPFSRMSIILSILTWRS